MLLMYHIFKMITWLHVTAVAGYTIRWFSSLLGNDPHLPPSHEGVATRKYAIKQELLILLAKKSSKPNIDSKN